MQAPEQCPRECSEHHTFAPPCLLASSPDGPDDYLLRDVVFDLVGEVYTDRVVAIVRDWLGTYERAGCSLGDAQAELELEP